jgi:hypothetical protein
MWFILIPALVVLVLSAGAAYITVEARGGKGREAPITLETGLRAAATLGLLGLIVVVFNAIKEALSDTGIAARLMASATAQSDGVSWPMATIISVLIICMTTIVLGVLLSIWHIVRQD